MVVRVELIAKRDNTYTVYGFKSLDNSEYYLVTKLPNWQVPDIEIGDKGLLEYITAIAGEEYYEVETETKGTYKYSNLYFKNFLKESLQENKQLIL